LAATCTLAKQGQWESPPSRAVFIRGGASKPNGVAGSKKKAPAQKKTPATKLTVSQDGTTIPPLVFNLVKGIVGAGVLSLPAGIAAFGDSPSALIPALILISIIGVLSAFGFALIGKVCAYTGAKSYGEAWKESVGASSAWIPTWSATFMTFSACLAYSMILADTFSSLLQTTERTKVLLGITGAVLLPLCWMKDLASLAPFSLLGVLGMGYTAVAMTKRFLDGSYITPLIQSSLNDEGETIETTLRAAGALLEHVPHDLKPSFGEAGWRSVFTPNSLILVCMLSTAYMAHFNAPRFYIELKENTMSRYYTVVASSFGLSIVLMGFIAALGFLTFGKAASGLVLNNYAPNDLWMSASRVAVAVSLVFGYPLAFQGCRDGVLDVLRIPEEKKKSNALLNTTTVALLALLTVMAATLKDVSFVLALVGATLGNLLTYVYPAIMYRGVVKKLELPGETVGIVIATLSAVLGIVMGAIGAKMALDQQK
jgi:amino acid permease